MTTQGSGGNGRGTGTQTQDARGGDSHRSDTPAGPAATGAETEDKAPSTLTQATSKAQELAGQVTEKAQNLAGQVADKAQAFGGQNFDQVTDRAQDMASQAQQNVLETSNGLMRQLESMSVENYYYAAAGSLALTALLLLLGRRSLASFVGLWTAILLNLGLFSRFSKAAESARGSGSSGAKRQGTL